MREILLDRRLQTMVNDYVPSGEILDDLVCFFSIFSDYTRLRIVSALAITKMCVSDISSVLKLNQTTVSHQLRFLKTLNAVKTERQGKVIFYSRNVYLVENSNVHFLFVSGLIELSEKIGFVESLGKFIEIAYHIGAFLPHRLYWNYYRVVVDILTEGICQGGLTCT